MTKKQENNIYLLFLCRLEWKEKENDTVGNIQEAKTYTLTGTTATATKKYTYGDASWNNLLTAYDGKEITYDGAGNPLAYNNRTAWKFTWEKGRELSSASADGKNITFTYDVDGIRESKTINGVKHEYVTLDGLIYQEKWGNVIVSTGTDSGIGAVNLLLYRGYYYDSEYYILMIANFLNIYTERQLRIKQ